ncbi:MAG: YybH family protein [Terriglobales bacterium]
MKGPVYDCYRVIRKLHAHARASLAVLVLCFSTATSAQMMFHGVSTTGGASGQASVPGQEAALAPESKYPEAIRRLHEIDMRAGKAGDVETLASLWAEDAVALPPGMPPIIGQAAIRQWLLSSRPDMKKVVITKYLLNFKEVIVEGDYAFEWATTSIVARMQSPARIMEVSGNLMRVLRRQSDGSWKIARSAWNQAHPTIRK